MQKEHFLGDLKTHSFQQILMIDSEEIQVSMQNITLSKDCISLFKQSINPCSLFFVIKYSFYIPTRFHVVLGGVFQSENKFCAVCFYFFFSFSRRDSRGVSRGTFSARCNHDLTGRVNTQTYSNDMNNVSCNPVHNITGGEI